MKPKFIADINVGRLARMLRMLGYDTLFVNGADDNELVRIAIRENRILLTKDTGIMQRRVVTEGKAPTLLIESDDVRQQLRQVVNGLCLEPDSDPFSICMECNEPLIPRERKEVRNLVPPYVFKTQKHFMQCPGCERVYWKGTHWERMVEELEALKG